MKNWSIKCWLRKLAVKKEAERYVKAVIDSNSKRDADLKSLGDNWDSLSNKKLLTLN